jgi:AraC-like DNA-binding protein
MYYNRTGEKIIYADTLGNNSFLHIWLAGVTNPNSKYFITHNISKSTYWDRYVFEYVVKGKGYIDTKTDRYSVVAGDAYFLNRLQQHIYYADKDEPYEKLFIVVKGDFVDSIVSSYRLNAGVIVKKTNIKHIFEELLSILETDKLTREHYDKITVCLLKIAQSMSDIKYESVPLKQPLAEMIGTYINDHIYEHITLHGISGALNISKSHIERVFKEKFGETPLKYVAKRKIDLAANLLLSTNFSIEEISDFFSFSDAKHFSKSFKARFNLSPMRYKKQMRK